MVGALCVGYGRRAYAACTGTLGTYSCSGANTTTITLARRRPQPALRYDDLGFSVITTTGDALDLTTTSSSVPSGGVDLSFTDANASTITGAHSGIYAKNSGPEGLTISSNGTVTGQALYGIFADNATSSASFLSITALNASGGSGPGGAGIKAVNFGDKGTNITATGTVSGYFGITVKNYATSIVSQAVSIYAATVTGAYEGIYAANKSSHGDLKISTTGTVTGATGRGIYANNSGGSLTINAATVTGQTDGINAKNSGNGALSVTTTGTVTGTNGYGIRAVNQPNGTSATIIAQGDVSGGATGIYGKNTGSGDLYIKSTGSVTGTSFNGITALNYNGALTIKAATVTGGSDGIYASNYGGGDLSITTTGPVVGGSDDGVNATTQSGALSITTMGTVTGGLATPGSNGSGIYARNYYGSSLTIKTYGAVTGSQYGVFAIFGGYGQEGQASGVLSITANGPVTGMTGSGIRAVNYGQSPYDEPGSSTSITVTKNGFVQGKVAGITAISKYNQAPITITNNGTVQNLSGLSTDLAIRAYGGPIDSHQQRHDHRRG